MGADYEFIAYQDTANEEIQNQIAMWNSRSDGEPDGSLSLHLAGGDMIQLKDIAKRVRAAVL